MTTQPESPKYKTRTFVIAITIGILLIVVGGAVLPILYNVLMEAVLNEVSVVQVLLGASFVKQFTSGLLYFFQSPVQDYFQ